MNMFVSWKTTTTGLTMLVVAVFGLKKALLPAWEAGDPTGVIGPLGILLAGIGLICARDNNVTSEQAGAKGEVSRGGAESAEGVKTIAGGSLPALAFAVLGLCFLSGCALVDPLARAVSSPVVTSHPVTNVVTQWQVVTNVVREVVTMPGETNTVTNVVTQLVTNTVAVPQIQTVYVTNWVEKASLESGLKLASAGAAFVPPPYGTAATAALGIVSAGLALLVRRKNQQAQVLTEANDSLGTQLQAVVRGVEQVTAAIDPTTGAKVKGLIAETSKALGVADDLHATVQELTKV